MRFRIVDITTMNTPSPDGGAQADLRLLDSPDVIVTLRGGGTTLVKGTTVELPQQPAQGGGLNIALVALPGGALTPNASVSVQFVLGVQQGGSFRFIVNVEAVTAASAANTTKAGALGKS